MSVAGTGIEAEVREERTLAETLRLYLDITRPRVMALVVFTGLPALVLGKEVWPTPAQAFWVLLGTAFAGGASSAFNAYVERDTDAFMARTRRRPLPASSVLPGAVLGYGVLLTVLSTVVLYAVGGWLPVAVSLATIAFYVFAYTMWLKPRTPQNIVIGGAAGGTAPLIASAAMDGSISLGAWILFAIVFLWTPPHFWGIALMRQKEYAAAGLPMMPHAVGDQGTRWRSLGYTLALVPVTLLPVWLGYLGSVYLAAALALGAWFTGLVVRSLVLRRHAVDWGVFKGSVAYLSLLFLVMLVDLATPWGT
ncbi:MAG: protoheme IX farnesyltransferase [Alphaproteobacteria bacterium]|nr:protoheme IX farnesyltransferase [Alphaproteobacteria bacterium]